MEAFGSTAVVLACAASAGAHAGLVPAHLQDERRLGVAFLVAVALLVSAFIAVRLRPSDPRVIAGAAFALWLTQPLGRGARSVHVQEVTR